MPLASTPAIQQMVLDDSTRGEGARSYSLPHRPRPERSVRLMLERCDNYGGRSGFNAISDDAFQAGSLEDAFPPRPPASGSLEDAFPPKRSGHGGRSMGGSLEDAFPPQQRGSGSLEDAFPPRSGRGSNAAGSLEDAFPSRQRDIGVRISRGSEHVLSRASGSGSSTGVAARPLIRRSGSRPNSGSGSRPHSGSHAAFSRG